MADIVEAPLQWVISNYGSADFIWTLGSPAIKIHTTYVGDALSSIMQAAIDLQIGSGRTHAAFEGEPAGTRIIFGRTRDDLFVQIVAFSGLSDWTGGALRWAGHVSVAEFVTAVREMAEAILNEHGEAGYARLWGGLPFPMEELAALRLSL